MAKLTINLKEYELKYTIESWKKLKEKHDITPNNIQEKLNEDMASCISNLIMFGILPSERESVKQQDIDSSFGFEIMDILMPIIYQGMPESAKSSAKDDEPKNDLT